MPCPVSLEGLVRVPNTRPLWPKDILAIVEEIEGDPTGKGGWGVLADLLKEERYNEPDLAEACAWIFRREKVKVARHDTRRARWTLGGEVPTAVAHAMPSLYDDEHDLSSPLGLAAALAQALRTIKAQLL